MPNARHLASVPALIEPPVTDDEYDAIEAELFSLIRMCPGERTLAQEMRPLQIVRD